MSDKEILVALTGVVLPVIIAGILRPTWSDRRRQLITFAVVLAWTLGGAFFANDATIPTAWDWRSVVRLLGLNVLAAFVLFKQLKELGIIQRIEAATSPVSGPQQQLLAEARSKETPPRDPEVTPRGEATP